MSMIHNWPSTQEYYDSIYLKFLKRNCAKRGGGEALSKYR